jgi:hypothetical protein
MDLSIKENRIKAIEEIQKSFISELVSKGIELSPNAICRISGFSIEIGCVEQNSIKDTDFFYSSIELYSAIGDAVWSINENKINFGSSGSFTPKDKSSYWRIIHAASIIKNWDICCELVNRHCLMYIELMKKIETQTNIKQQ